MPKELAPFHESVVLMIEIATPSQLDLLGELIQRTKIPAGHDEIIAAWQKRRRALREKYHLYATGEDITIISLLEQKEGKELAASHQSAIPVGSD